MVAINVEEFKPPLLKVEATKVEAINVEDTIVEATNFEPILKPSSVKLMVVGAAKEVYKYGADF